MWCLVLRQVPMPFKSGKARKLCQSLHWLSVMFELGRDEVGSTVDAETHIAADLVELFDTLGLAVPAPVALLGVEHQIVQKLHACTSQGRVTEGNDRAHDLVDLQILVQEEPIDLHTVAIVGQRLFASRRTQAWPPVVVEYASWASIYREAADGLDVLDDVTAAVAWANEFIASIEPT